MSEKDCKIANVLSKDLENTRGNTRIRPTIFRWFFLFRRSVGARLETVSTLVAAISLPFPSWPSSEADPLVWRTPKSDQSLTRIPIQFQILSRKGKVWGPARWAQKTAAGTPAKLRASFLRSHFIILEIALRPEQLLKTIDLLNLQEIKKNSSIH